jgi:hypothetical protein
VLIAAGLVVAAIGAAGALYLRAAEQTPEGPPPVIAAPEGPDKVAPQESQTAATEETVGDAVYDRVAGNAPETEEQVVESAEEPREIARIVLPQTQEEADAALVRPVGEEGAEPQMAAGEPEAASAPASDDEIGPRRVPTFVVRPDGTVVATSEAPSDTSSAAASADLAEQQTVVASETAAVEPDPVATVAIGAPPEGAEENGLRGSSTDAIGSTTAVDGPVVAPQEWPAESEALPAIAAIEPAPAPAEADNSESAVDLLTNAPDAAAVLPAPASSGQAGYLVQVSSQRSQDQAEAAFAGMQSRFGSVLGGMSPTIQQADLGAQGIYYRVRVGPWSTREEAIQVCEALKAAGGDCFVVQ